MSLRSHAYDCFFAASEIGKGEILELWDIAGFVLGITRWS
jgi:hypothetical protein